MSFTVFIMTYAAQKDKIDYVLICEFHVLFWEKWYFHIGNDKVNDYVHETLF